MEKLRLHACRVAEFMLNAEVRAGRVTDPRSWRAVEVSRRFAKGEATEEELVQANDDAFDAEVCIEPTLDDWEHDYVYLAQCEAAQAAYATTNPSPFLAADNADVHFMEYKKAVEKIKVTSLCGIIQEVNGYYVADMGFLSAVGPSPMAALSRLTTLVMLKTDNIHKVDISDDFKTFSVQLSVDELDILEGI